LHEAPKYRKQFCLAYRGILVSPEAQGTHSADFLDRPKIALDLFTQLASHEILNDFFTSG